MFILLQFFSPRWWCGGVCVSIVPEEKGKAAASGVNADDDAAFVALLNKQNEQKVKVASAFNYHRSLPYALFLTPCAYALCGTVAWCRRRRMRRKARTIGMIKDGKVRAHHSPHRTRHSAAHHCRVVVC
jgi:hypothetical protein